MDREEFHEWQIRRAARLLQRATHAKYTVCRKYVEDVHKDENGDADYVHYHIFSVYDKPFEVDEEIIFRLRCVSCGGNTFAFAVKTYLVVED